jgi:hypothetical protein
MTLLCGLPGIKSRGIEQGTGAMNTRPAEEETKIISPFSSLLFQNNREYSGTMKTVEVKIIFSSSL